MVSSGDTGVSSDYFCFGTYYEPIFTPSFPASCPYITSVGATSLPAGKAVGKDPEVASVQFSSGGGFSNIFLAPDYQKAAINNFFTKNPPSYPYYLAENNQSVGANYGWYNRQGRGFPDFAAIGENYVLPFEGYTETVGGTSLSAPVFASILTRINEERLLAGKTTIGFVNPVLYKHPGVLHDITVGTNPGCFDTYYYADGFSCGPG